MIETMTTIVVPVMDYKAGLPHETLKEERHTRKMIHNFAFPRRSTKSQYRGVFIF
jgi:hypothetical protein